MKKTLLIAAALLLVIPAAAFAQTSQSITISAQLDRGVNLPAPVIRNCPGSLPLDGNPFASPCTSATSIGFSTLSHTFVTNGVTTEAGCFYSPNMFMVFLYPGVWGGAGFTLNQTFTWTGTGLPTNAVVMTPAYSALDLWDATKPATGTNLNGPMTGATLGAVGAATTTRLIYNAPAPAVSHIVRAIYSIPPMPASGTPVYSGWTPLVLSTPSGTYTGNAVFTITQL